MAIQPNPQAPRNVTIRRLPPVTDLLPTMGCLKAAVDGVCTLTEHPDLAHASPKWVGPDSSHGFSCHMITCYTFLRVVVDVIWDRSL